MGRRDRGTLRTPEVNMIFAFLHTCTVKHLYSDNIMALSDPKGTLRKNQHRI